MAKGPAAARGRAGSQRNRSVHGGVELRGPRLGRASWTCSPGWQGGQGGQEHRRRAAWNVARGWLEAGGRPRETEPPPAWPSRQGLTAAGRNVEKKPKQTVPPLACAGKENPTCPGSPASSPPTGCKAPAPHPHSLPAPAAGASFPGPVGLAVQGGCRRPAVQRAAAVSNGSRASVRLLPCHGQ